MAAQVCRPGSPSPRVAAGAGAPGVDWHKPFLEVVPWIVVVFEELFGFNNAGSKRKNYYVRESVGIACGLFITALDSLYAIQTRVQGAR